MVGEIIGAIFFVQLGDVIGRKLLMVITVSVKIVMLVWIAFSSSLYLTYFLFVIQGIAEVASFTMSFILVFELV